MSKVSVATSAHLRFCWERLQDAVLSLGYSYI